MVNHELIDCDEWVKNDWNTW